MREMNKLAYISFFIFVIHFFIFLIRNNLSTFSGITVLLLIIASLSSEFYLISFKKYVKEYAFIPWISFLIGLIIYINLCIRLSGAGFINVFLVVLLIALTSILFCNLVLPEKYHLKLRKYG